MYIYIYIVSIKSFRETKKNHCQMSKKNRKSGKFYQKKKELQNVMWQSWIKT